jgi:hypothetical protein
VTETQLNDLVHVAENRRAQIVAAKRPEYTQASPDVLNNFKVVAAELHCDPLQVWFVYFRKHVASISQFCADPDRNMSEPIEGRIDDCMNYLDLLRGLVAERKEDDIPF